MTKRSQGMAARHATPKKSKRRTKQVLHPAQQFSADSVYRETDEEPRPRAYSSPPVPRARVRSALQALSTDYHYVTSDLKHIAVTAGILVAVMVLLTFVVK